MGVRQVGTLVGFSIHSSFRTASSASSATYFALSEVADFVNCHALRQCGHGLSI